jgi:Domain of unknown function (DUF5753)/Helix-turn-helix domain
MEAAHRSGIGGQSKLSKVELGKLLPKNEDVERLCDLYDAMPSERQRLLQLAELVREQSRRSRVVLSRGGAANVQDRIAEIEAGTTSFRVFEPCLVVGLAQTEAYARCIFRTELQGDDLESAVAARLARSSILDDEERTFTFIMTEGALRWQAGSPAVMAGQIEALIDVSRRPNVHLGVIPWHVPVDVFPRHGWWIYDSSLVLFGTEIAAGTHADTDDVAVYARLFAKLDSLAVYGSQARRELARIATDYRRMS